MLWGRCFPSGNKLEASQKLHPWEVFAVARSCHASRGIKVRNELHGVMLGQLMVKHQSKLGVAEDNLTTRCRQPGAHGVNLDKSGPLEIPEELASIKT